MVATAQNVWRNILGGVLTSYGVVAFALFFALDQRWVNTAPRTPNPIVGLVFAHNEHGVVTYLSAFQATSLALLFATSIPLAFLGMIIAPKKNINWKGSFFIFGSAKWDQDDPKRILKWSAISGAVVAPVIIFLIGPSLVHWLNRIGFIVNF
jgi:hypothetical protein